MKNILLLKILMITFLYSCHSQNKILQMKTATLEKVPIDLNIKLKDSVDNKYIEMVFINHADYAIKISKPGCWINFQSILKKEITPNDFEEIAIQLKIKVDPSCAKEFFIIEAHKEESFIVPYSFNKLYDVGNLKGNFILQVNYFGTITDQNNNILKENDEKVSSGIIKFLF